MLSLSWRSNLFVLAAKVFVFFRTIVFNAEDRRNITRREEKNLFILLIVKLVSKSLRNEERIFQFCEKIRSSVERLKVFKFFSTIIMKESTQLLFFNK